MSNTSAIERIDPEAVAELFATKWAGYRPVRNCFYVADGCCVNTILAMEAAGEVKAIAAAMGLKIYSDAAQLAALSGLDPDYAVGLAAGWDDYRSSILILSELGRLDFDTVELGFADGKAAWEACQRALIPVPA